MNAARRRELRSPVLPLSSANWPNACAFAAWYTRVRTVNNCQHVTRGHVRCDSRRRLHTFHTYHRRAARRAKRRVDQVINKHIHLLIHLWRDADAPVIHAGSCQQRYERPRLGPAMVLGRVAAWDRCSSKRNVKNDTYAPPPRRWVTHLVDKVRGVALRAASKGAAG